MICLLVHTVHWITTRRECECAIRLVDDTDDVIFSLNEPVERGPDNWQLGRGVKQGRYIGGSSLQY
jgi:hypothetical protein